MFRLHKFKPGDLVKIKTPYISRNKKRKYLNKFTGVNTLLPTFNVEGVANKLAFAKILTKKKFICAYPSCNYSYHPEYYLFDNYKPEFYGRGYRIECTNQNIFVKVGHVCDVRKMPFPTQQYANMIIENRYNQHPYYKTQGMTRVERIAFLNSTPTIMHHSDKGISFALMMAGSNSCPECGISLINNNIKVSHLSNVFVNKIKQRIIKYYNVDEIHITLFPAGYNCTNCGGLSVLYKINKNTETFELFWCGYTKEYLKK
ncbi:MAG: hypothetical protein KAS32_27390 [Candidatus Peribacteraceae bacterium]|nr:hypothetical protein [Candidatus Peribacteraceae bacterium]